MHAPLAHVRPSGRVYQNRNGKNRYKKRMEVKVKNMQLKTNGPEPAILQQEDSNDVIRDRGKTVELDRIHRDIC